MPESTSRKAVLAWVAALLGALLTAGAWSIASPAGSSPDDNFHVGTIWCESVWHSGRCTFQEQAAGAYGQSWYLVPPEAAFSGSESSTTAPCYIFDSSHSGDCPLPTGQTRLPINDGLYPPVYYAFAGLFAADDMNQTVVQVRLAVSLSVILLLAAAYAASLPWLRPAFLVSVAVGLVPLGLSVIASTNPSGWAVAGVIASWPLAVTTLLAADRRGRITAAILWLVAAVMACGSRADAAAYIALISVLATAVLWKRVSWASRGMAGLVAVGSAFVLLGSGQTSNVTSGFLEDVGARSTGLLVWQAIKGIPGLWFGGTGAPGGPFNTVTNQLAWFDVPIPPAAWIGLLLVIGALMFIGIAWLPWPKAVALGGLVLALAALSFYTLLSNKAFPGELVQPRYLLPLVLTVFGVALIRPAWNPLHLTGAQAVIAIVFVSMAQALSLHVFMRRFLTGIDADGPNLAGAPEWWWTSSLSPMLVWLLGALGWTLVVVVALWPLYRASRGSAPAAQPPGAQRSSETLAREAL